MSRVVNKNPVSTRKNSNQSVFDKISALLSEVKSSNTSDDSGPEFTAFILYVNKLSLQKFKEIFGNNKAFYEGVLETDNAHSPQSSDEILEIFVQIPGICDFLPEPNIRAFTDIIEKKDQIAEALSPAAQFAKAETAAKAYDQAKRNTESALEAKANAQKLISEADNPNAAAAFVNATEADRILTKAKQENAVALQALGNNLNNLLETPEEAFNNAILDALEVITMYPRIYKLTKGGKTYSPGQVCKVELPYDDKTTIPTMGYGFFKNILRGNIKTQGSGIEQQIKKLLKQERRKLKPQ